MNSEKQLFEEKLISKANNVWDTVTNHLQSLQNINALFTFESGKSEKLTEKGHRILTSVGLLQNNGGICEKCNKERSLIKKTKEIDYYGSATDARKLQKVFEMDLFLVQVKNHSAH